MLRTLRSATLSTGVTLPYVEQGDADGVPVLFLHGVTDSWHSFEQVLGRLPAGIRAIALTQRGHGDADKPEGDYRIPDMAEDAVALLDHLGIERAVVAGHSMGGWVAQQVAIAHSDRVCGVILIAAFAAAGDDPEFAAFADEMAALEDPIPDAVARDFQVSTLAREIEPELLDLFVSESLKVPARVWGSAFSGFVELDLTDDLPRIQAPALIVWGDQDAFVTRAAVDLLHERIPGARLAVYEGIGHAVHWDDPERFAAEVAAFVDGLG